MLKYLLGLKLSRQSCTFNNDTLSRRSLSTRQGEIMVIFYSFLAVFNLVVSLISFQQGQWGWAIIQLGLAGWMATMIWKYHERV